MLGLGGAHGGNDAVVLVGRDGAQLARCQPVRGVQAKGDEPVQVVLRGVVRRAEVGEGALHVVQHQGGREVVVRHLTGDLGPREVAVCEPVVVADEQGLPGRAGHLVGAGVAVAGASVEVEQEQVVDQRGVEPLHRGSVVVVGDRDGIVEQGGDRVGVVDPRGAGVPRLAGAVAPVRRTGALPEVEDGRGARGIVTLRIDHRHDLAAQQEEVGDGPQVAGVDLAAGTTRPPADLLRRHGRLDALHHRRVAEVGLGTATTM